VPVVHTVILVTWDAEIGRVEVPGWPAQKVRPYLKNNQRLKGWSCGSNSKHLPKMLKALSSNLRIAKVTNTTNKKRARHCATCLYF
jgi:hypothetical protein